MLYRMIINLRVYYLYQLLVSGCHADSLHKCSYFLKKYACKCIKLTSCRTVVPRQIWVDWHALEMCFFYFIFIGKRSQIVENWVFCLNCNLVRNIHTEPPTSHHLSALDTQKFYEVVYKCTNSLAKRKASLFSSYFSRLIRKLTFFKVNALDKTWAIFLNLHHLNIDNMKMPYFGKSMIMNVLEFLQ